MSAYVVVDANFIGRGHFDANRLEDLADRVKFTGALIVVPEVVVWEWAEHAHVTIEDARRAVAVMRSHVDRSLTPRMTTHEDLGSDQLAAQIEALAEKMYNVVVERTTGDSAIAALRAQVLLSDPVAHRKDGVKTGAADALIVECLKRWASKGDYGIALGSSDKRLIAASEAVIPDLMVVRSHNELFERIFERAPDVRSLVEHVDEFAINEVGGSSAYAGDVSSFAMGYELIPENEGRDGGRVSLAMGHIDLVETDGFTPLASGDIRLATIEVDLFGTVIITEFTQDPDGTPTSHDHLIGNVKVSVPSMVTFDDEWRPTTIEVTGRSRVYFG